MPTSSIGECDPEVTSPPPVDRHALPRDRLLLHHERDELRARARRSLIAAQRLDAGELLVERAGPAEPGRDRVGARARCRCRAAGSTPRAAACRARRARTARRRARAPRPRARAASSAMHEELEAVLARVAGAVDHALDAVDRRPRARERRRSAEAELRRARAGPAPRAARTRRRRRARRSRGSRAP